MKANPLFSKLILFLFVACFLTQSPHAQDTATPQKPGTHVFTKDMTIYVSDFELDAQNVNVDKGGVVGQVRPGILERPSKREKRDPEAQAKKLVDLMSSTIVTDLQKAGYKAQRLPTGNARPATGAWIHGVFTEVDEGNQRRRALIGFGSGEANMELYVTLTDLAYPDKPLYNEAKDQDSGKKIGAVITMNPYVAAAKYVMEKNAPEKAVKKTASEISAETVKQLKANSAGTATR
jgi:hypothetical protein